MELLVPDAFIADQPGSSRDAAQAGLVAVMPGRRRGDTGWIVIGSDDHGHRQTRCFASEAEARSAARDWAPRSEDDVCASASGQVMTPYEMLSLNQKWKISC